VIVLRYWEDLTVEQTAEALHCAGNRHEPVVPGIENTTDNAWRQSQRTAVMRRTVEGDDRRTAAGPAARSLRTDTAPALDDHELVLELQRRRQTRRLARRWAITAVLVAIALVTVFVLA
jgi:hypothetical protein